MIPYALDGLVYLHLVCLGDFSMQNHDCTLLNHTNALNLNYLIKCKPTALIMDFDTMSPSFYCDSRVLKFASYHEIKASKSKVCMLVNIQKQVIPHNLPTWHNTTITIFTTCSVKDDVSFVILGQRLHDDEMNIPVHQFLQ